MIKVMHLLSTKEYSGAEKVAENIALALNKKKYEPIMVCCAESLASKFRESGLKTYVVDEYSGPKLFLFNPQIKSIIESEDISLIHAHDVNASIKAYLVGHSKNIVIVSHIHNCYNWLKGINYKRIIDALFRNQYDLSIACSDYTKEYYISYGCFVNPKKIFVLKNSLNLNEIGKNNERKPRRKLTHLIFVGRLSKQKRIDILLKAFKYAGSIRPNIDLMIVGDGEERSVLEILSQQLGLTNRVHFVGRKDNIYELFEKSDVVLLTSDYEGLPMVLLEAMAKGKVVLSTDVGGVHEIINTKTGILVDKGDYRKIGEKIVYLYDNWLELSPVYAKNAMQLVQTRFNMINYIKKIERIYNSLVRVNKNEKN